MVIPGNGGEAGTSDVRPAAPAVSDHSKEVIRMAVSAPKLNIPADIKLSNLGRVTAPRARAFVRNVGKYLDIVHGGHQDHMRCLYLANALNCSCIPEPF